MVVASVFGDLAVEKRCEYSGYLDLIGMLNGINFLSTFFSFIC